MNSKTFWNIIAIFITILLLSQIMNLKYGESYWIAVLWWGISILPITVMYNRQEVKPVINKGVRMLLIGFALLLLIVVFGEPLVTTFTEQTSNNLLLSSLLIITPINLFLCIQLNNSKRDTLTTNDENDKTENDIFNSIDQARKNISKGRMKDAFEILFSIREHYHYSLFNDINLLKNKFEEYKRSKSLTLNSFEENSISNAQIVNALLEILSKIEEDCRQQSAKRQ